MMRTVDQVELALTERDRGPAGGQTVIRTMTTKSHDVLIDLCRLSLTLNDAPTWGHPTGTLLLARFWWQKVWTAAGELEYHIELDIDRSGTTASWPGRVTVERGDGVKEVTKLAPHDKACWSNIKDSVEALPALNLPGDKP